MIETGYPSILRRYFSTFIDSLFIISLLIALGYVFQEQNETATAVKVTATIFFFFIYEPLFTSFFCTLGQKITGIRVRTKYTHEKISLPAAYIRIIVKIFLGIISFFSIPFSQEKRAIHDLIIGSVVIYN